MEEFGGSVKLVRVRTRRLTPEEPGEKPVEDRALKIPGYDQAALLRTRLAIIGAGGLGTPIALWAVRKGLSITIYDGDVVELSNLYRQFFYKEDLYKNKAIQLAKNVAKEGTLGVEVQAVPLMFQRAVEDLTVQPFDIAVCGVDNDATRVFVSAYCLRLKRPAIFTAVNDLAESGYVFVQTSAQEDPCFACFIPRAYSDPKVANCDAGSAPDILQAMAAHVLYAIDSLVMPGRKRAWTCKEVSLSGYLPDGPRPVPKKADCPLCASA